MFGLLFCWIRFVEYYVAHGNILHYTKYGIESSNQSKIIFYPFLHSSYILVAYSNTQSKSEMWNEKIPFLIRCIWKWQMKKNKYTCGIHYTVAHTQTYIVHVLLRADVCTHYHWACTMSSKAHLVCLLCSGGEFYPTEQIRSTMKRRNKRICAATYKVSRTKNELRKLICNFIDLIWSRNIHTCSNQPFACFAFAYVIEVKVKWNAKKRTNLRTNNAPCSIQRPYREWCNLSAITEHATCTLPVL